MLKKVLLAGGVILIIIGLVIFTNHKSDDAVIPPKVSQNNSNTSSYSPTPVVTGPLKDGTYTGIVADAFYGNVQVAATIQNGKITDIAFLQFPNSPGHTTEVSTVALPQLKQEAITSQKAQVDIVSGATQDTEAFRQSLQSALDKAKS